MAKTIQAKMRKVVAGTDIKGVELLAVNASYNPNEVHSAICAIASNDSFIDSLPTEGACYNIEDCGDEFKIDEIAEMSTCPDQCLLMLRTAYSFRNTLDYIRWNAIGSDLDNIRCTAANLQWSIQDQINQIAEWAVIDLGKLPHPDTFTCVDGQPACQSLGFEIGCNESAIIQSMECYVAALEVFYCNMPHERKTIIDRWINDWKHECEYRLKRKILTDTICAPAFCG